MIQPFVDKFIASKEILISEFLAKKPEDYDSLVARLIQLLHVEDDYDTPDPERIHIIDDGDYQGTRLYIIGAIGYQPSDYYSIFVPYGSCSGCDTFQAIRSYETDNPTEQEANEYYTLMLHMVQSMKKVRDGAKNS